jgi:hypothetical protein
MISIKGKVYRVHLTAEEKKRLEDIVNKRVHPTREVKRAHILLLLNEGEDREGKPVAEQSEIAERCGCTRRVAYTVSRHYVKERIERVLKREAAPAKATGKIEAKIIALSCSEPPQGYSRRTLRLLEERSKAAIGIELSDTTIWAV